MSTAFLPSLTIVIVGGWIVVPAMFSRALPLLIAGTVFLAWTKLTETIVAERGSLPSLYQCYYKVVCGSWLRNKTLPPTGPAVPPISSEAADVVFSIKTQFDHDRMAASWRPEPVLPTDSASSAAAADSSSSSSSASSSSASVRDKSAPAPPPPSAAVPAVTITPEMRSVIAMTRSSLLPLSPAFYTVPCFSMDLSIMVFSAFPLRVLDAMLIRTDLTVLRPAHRRARLSFATRIANHVERNGDVELDFISDISLDLDTMPLLTYNSGSSSSNDNTANSADRNATTPAASHTAGTSQIPTGPRRNGAGGSAESAKAPLPLKARRMAPVARVVNTYRFPGAAPRLRTDRSGADRNGAILTAPRVAVPAAAAVSASSSGSSGSGSSVNEFEFSLNATDTQAFANLTGNVHPRHWPAWAARLVSEETGGAIMDPFQLASTMLAAASDAEARVSSDNASAAESAAAALDGVKRPFRFVFEVEQAAQAPAQWQLRVGPRVNPDDNARSGSAKSGKGDDLFEVIASLPTAVSSTVDATAAAAAAAASEEDKERAKRAAARAEAEAAAAAVYSLGPVTAARVVSAELDVGHSNTVRCARAVVLLGAVKTDEAVESERGGKKVKPQQTQTQAQTAPNVPSPAKVEEVKEEEEEAAKASAKLVETEAETASESAAEAKAEAEAEAETAKTTEKSVDE